MSVSTKLLRSELIRFSAGRCLAFTAGLMAAACCAAQSTAVPPGISERVLRDAASPMRWIKVHSEPARAEAESRPAPAPAARRPAAPATPKAELAVRPSSAPAAAVPSARQVSGDTVAVAPMAATSQPGPGAALAEPELVVIDRADPEWDDEVIRKLGAGRVLARFQVSEDGYLSRIQIVDSASPRLTGPVMAALMQWRFEPIPRSRAATAEFGFGTDQPAKERAR